MISQCDHSSVCLVIHTSNCLIIFLLIEKGQMGWTPIYQFRVQSVLSRYCIQLGFLSETIMENVAYLPTWQQLREFTKYAKPSTRQIRHWISVKPQSDEETCACDHLQRWSIHQINYWCAQAPLWYLFVLRCVNEDLDEAWQKSLMHPAAFFLCNIINWKLKNSAALTNWNDECIFYK